MSNGADASVQADSSDFSASGAAQWVGLAIMVVLVATGVGTLIWLVFDRDIDQEVAVILLTTAMIILLFAIGIVALAFTKAGLGKSDQALGLPAGSVRALIAFFLLLIFGLLTIFLFTNVDDEQGTLQGVSATRFDELLDDGKVVESTVTRTNDDGVPETYTVTIASEASQSQQDLAKQLTTALVTLVAALAAFYFGAKTTTTTTDQLVKWATEPREDGTDAGKEPDGKPGGDDGGGQQEAKPVVPGSGGETVAGDDLVPKGGPPEKPAVVVPAVVPQGTETTVVAGTDMVPGGGPPAKKSAGSTPSPTPTSAAVATPVAATTVVAGSGEVPSGGPPPKRPAGDS